MRYQSPPYNFLRIDEKGCYEYSDSEFVIVPVPYERTASWKGGALRGPGAIITASQHMETYDQEQDNQPHKKGICTLSAQMFDCSAEEMVLGVEKVVEQIVADGKIPIVLGGEHSITTGPVKAVKNKYDDLSVLQLDAHADLREKWYVGEEGNSEMSKQSHACVMKRIVDLGAKTVQVGIRSLSVEEARLIKNKKLDVYFARNLFYNNLWMEQAVNKLSENVYVTFDLDVLDPAIMNATGTPEPGGLDWNTTMEFLRKVFEKKNVVGFDVVELAPNGNHSCEFLAAKIVYKMIGYC